jgi:hypothetical protein
VGGRAVKEEKKHKARLNNNKFYEELIVYKSFATY